MNPPLHLIPWFTGDRIPAVKAGVRVGAEDSFAVRKFEFVERVGEPYVLDLELATDSDLDLKTLIGTATHLDYGRFGHTGRQISGVVTSSSFVRATEEHIHFGIRVEPALSLLRYTKRRRIFQDMTPIEVAHAVTKDVFESYQRRLVTDKLVQGYEKIDYLVQYDETDLDFFLRLLAEFGISLFFDQGETEIAVLWDDSSYPPVGAPLLSFEGDPPIFPFIESQPETASHESIQSLVSTYAAKTQRWEAKAWDWKAQQPVLLESAIQSPDGLGTVTVPPLRLPEQGQTEGMHTDSTLQWVEHAEHVEKIRAESFICTSNIHEIAPGACFEVTQHPHVDLDAPYVVVSVTHQAEFPEVDLHETESNQGQTYSNRIECIPQGVRPFPNRRPRPVGAGLHSAIVVGPPGEEIHTDPHGRVRVKMLWETEGENPTVWLRVMQPWAGQGFGMLFIPRVGMEVGISFLDGNLDRPVINGCLYNGGNTPPVELPENRTHTVLRTQSSPKGESDRFNELRFEDAAGQEEVFLRAQRNLRQRVGSFMQTTVGADHHLTVKRDAHHTVEGDETVQVQGDRVVHVEKNQTYTITGSQSFHVEGREGVDDKIGCYNFVDGEYVLQTRGPITIESRHNSTFSRIVMTPESITFQAKTILFESIEGDNTTGTEVEISPQGISAEGAEHIDLETPGGGVHLSTAASEIEGGKEGTRSSVRLNNHLAAESPETVQLQGREVKAVGTSQIDMESASIHAHAENDVEIKGDVVKTEGSSVSSVATGTHVIRGKPVRIN